MTTATTTTRLLKLTQHFRNPNQLLNLQQKSRNYGAQLHIYAKRATYLL